MAIKQILLLVIVAALQMSVASAESRDAVLPVSANKLPLVRTVAVMRASLQTSTSRAGDARIVNVLYHSNVALGQTVTVSF
jgi:hypothetical protein